MKTTTITIVSKPSKIEFNCPHCENHIQINYEEFANDMPNSWVDWQGKTFTCPECGEEIEIEEWDYD